MNRILYILWLLLPWGITDAQVPVFHRLQTEDGEQVKAKVMHQDHRGWLWMGSQRGVYRYDGIDYEYFTLPDSIPGNPAVSAIFDRGDTLWIGFDNGLIGTLTRQHTYASRSLGNNHQLKSKQGSVTIWAPEEGLPAQKITGFAPDKNGYLWISTYGEGLYVWTGARLFLVNAEDDHLCSDEIYTILADNEGQIWAATDNGISIVTFSTAEQKNVRNIGLADGLPDEIVTALHKDQSGNIWIGTHDRGVCTYDAQKRAILPVWEQWDYGEVLALVVFDQYETWISTSEGGLLICNNRGQCRAIETPAKSRQILRDREGLLWLLSDQESLYSANLSAMNMTTSLNGVQAVCSDNKGHIWAGSQQGLFVQNNHTWRPVGTKNNVISLLSTPDNRIWAGTFGEGICVYNTEGTLQKCINTTNGLPNGSILSMAVAGQKVWIATLSGVEVLDLATYAITGFEHICDHPDAAGFYVYKIFNDAKGRIWFCTDGHGLCLWDGTQLHLWQEANGVPFKTIYSITEDHQGTIWFSGEQTSLWSFDGQQFRQFTARDHLHSPQINSLSTTGSGQVVIAYNDGVDLLTPESKHILFLGENAGISLTNTSLNAACTDSFGHVWLGTAQGVSRVSGFAQTYQIDPAIQIKSVSNVSRMVDFYHEHSFAYDENHLVFEYTGIWLTNPGSVYFRYKLDGFDPDWIVSKDRTASYPNLPPGTYCFRIQASEHGRFEAVKEVTYSFVIRKPFWAEWWFILLALLFLGAAIRYYIEQREARLRQVQEMESEKIVAQLDVLKTQISPHFLFNSFNTLITIIEENPGVAVEYVQHLADFYRSIMVHREKNFIPLSEELEIVSNFGYLLKRRFEEALQIHIDVPEPTGQIMPLALQLLLENAVKHNVISKKHPLHIHIYRDGDVIVIKNNKNLKIKPEPGTRFGLQSLTKRYEVLTGRPVEIVQENGSFAVKVPLV